MALKISKKLQHRAPTFAQTATAQKATSRSAREIAPQPDPREKRRSCRPPSSESKGKKMNFDVDPTFQLK